MSTLQEIWNILTGTHGHSNLWLQWRDWPLYMEPTDWTAQPTVVSCSGRLLAQYDCRFDIWYLGSALYSLGYAPELDDAPASPPGSYIDQAFLSQH